MCEQVYSESWSTDFDHKTIFLVPFVSINNQPKQSPTYTSNIVSFEKADMSDHVHHDYIPLLNR